jgi:tripartite-type tricarboxylate transporter receptor subunit TctC
MKKLGLVAAAMSIAGAIAPAAEAQDFYKGKRLTVVIGSGAGGTYDLYARLLADNIGKFIPGNPTVIAENRAGAGSRVAMSYMYNKAPKDGTAIGIHTNLLPFDQFVFPDKPRDYDLTRFQYIGSMASLNGVIAVWHTAGVKTFKDIRSKTVVLGANSRLSETYIIPAVLNEMAGTKFKIVHGYPGNVSEIDLAMEKGEVAARGGSWASFLINHPDWVKEKKVIPIVQNGFKRDPLMPDVPLLKELAENDEQKATFDLLASGALFSRPFVAPPETPPERVAILRKAFMDLLSDKAFVKLAESRNYEISPSSAEELTAVLQDLKKTVKPEYAARIQPILQN